MMEKRSIANELASNAYPGRGIIIGKTPDGTKAVTAYFIMGKKRKQQKPYFRGGWQRHPHTGI